MHAMPSSDPNSIVASAYAAHAESLVRYLTGRTHDRCLAEDLAQEAFLRLTRVIHADRTPDNLMAWLVHVGGNLAVSRGRRDRVAMRHLRDLPNRRVDLLSPELAVLAAETGGTLRAAIGCLAPHERAAVLLAAEGVQASAIGRTIERSPAAARTILCRARAKLRLRIAQGEAAA
jgi:RNA polymerase sigma-70 factor, ECF subfamily